MAAFRNAALGGVLLTLASFAGATDSLAQSGGCSVEQAAQAALQRRLAVIDAAKVNPSDFFTGSNSCISGDLLKSFDLSTLIPDLAGFLSGGVQQLAQQAINMAKQQACEILNEQISGVIGKINNTTSSFNGGLSGDLAGILGKSFSIQKPSTPGYGSYNMSSLGNNFNFDGLQGAVSNVGTNMSVTSGSSSMVSPFSSSDSQSFDLPVTPPSPTSNAGASWLQN